MAPRLSDLPEELISNITCRLGDDKFALRATCRALEQKSFHEFATEHFSEKCVHLTTDSLKVLCDISSCPRLSKYVKKLSVITALFSEQSFTCPGSHAVAHWKPSVRQSEAYKFYMEDQRKLRTSGNDKLMLIEALSRLPSLKAVALIDSPDGLKDGTDYRGGNKVLRQTGTRPINVMNSTARVRSPEFRKHLEHLWSTLINALAGAHDKLSLEKFHTKLSSELTFIDPQEQLSLDPKLLSRLSKVFKETTNLHLHLKSPERGGYKAAVAKFARTFSNVKELALDFDMRPGSGPVYQKFVLGLDLSRLTSLHLLGLSVDAAHLTNSVTRLRDIVDLRFSCVEVTSGAWPAVLKGISNLERLDHLHLLYLRENGHKSYFLKQRDTPDNATNGFAFGEQWDEFDDPDEDDEGSTDDSMPELQPADDLWVPQTLAPQQSGPASDGIDQNDRDEPGSEDDAVSEYVPDDFLTDHSTERGFHICIKGHRKIIKRLRTFIDEYNVGEHMDEDDNGFFAGMGPMGIPMGFEHGVATVALGGAPGANLPPPPPAFNAFMNAMTGAAVGAAANPNINHAGANGNPFTAGGALFQLGLGPLPHFPAAAATAPATTNTTTAATSTTGATTTAAAPSLATASSSAGWDLSDDEDWEDDEE